MNLTDRIEGLGISLTTDYRDAQDHASGACIFGQERLADIQGVSLGTKEFSGSFAPNSLARLTESNNVSPDPATGTVVFSDAGLSQWREIAQATFIKSITVAARSLPQGMNGVKACRSARVYVCSTPSFTSVGVFNLFVRQLSLQLFPDEPAPNVSSVGVVSLPGGLPLAVDCRFSLFDEK